MTQKPLNKMMMIDFIRHLNQCGEFVIIHSWPKLLFPTMLSALYYRKDKLTDNVKSCVLVTLTPFSLFAELFFAHQEVCQWCLCSTTASATS